MEVGSELWRDEGLRGSVHHQGEDPKGEMGSITTFKVLESGSREPG